MPYRGRVRGRGQFSASVSRSGGAYNYAGRRVLVKGENFELNWRGPEVIMEVLTAVQDALANLSIDALNYMQNIVPVDTGALRDSCFVEINVGADGRIQLVIGADTPYAVYVELGTIRNDAQPYIRPTFDMVIRVLPGLLKNEVASRGKFVS